MSSQRVLKVESVVRQIVAGQFPELLGPAAGRLTITGVDVSPDLRQAIIWIGVLADTESQQQAEFQKVLDMAKDFQRAVAKGMTTKFVPRLEFRPDKGGEYAEYISKLMHDIS